MTLSIGDIIHASISVRGDRNLASEDASKKAAKPALDAWQEGQADKLTEGAVFKSQDRVTLNGAQNTVTRYLTVVEPDAGA